MNDILTLLLQAYLSLLIAVVNPTVPQSVRDAVQALGPIVAEVAERESAQTYFQSTPTTFPVEETNQPVETLPAVVPPPVIVEPVIPVPVDYPLPQRCDDRFAGFYSFSERGDCQHLKEAYNRCLEANGAIQTKDYGDKVCTL